MGKIILNGIEYASGGGGGGSSSLAGLTDVDITAPSDGQVLVYDANSSKWKNGGVLHKYSTTEHIIGEWIDGKPVYEISLNLNGMNIDRNKFFNTGILLSSLNIKSFVSDGTLIDNQTIRQAFPCCMASMAGNTIIGVGLNWFGTSDTRTFDYLIFRFTKTTD